MTDRSLAALAAALLLLTAAPAGAAESGPTSRAYVALSGFLVQVADVDFTDPAFPGTTFRVEPDLGFGARLAVGGIFLRDWRVEGEIAYRLNDAGELCAVSCVGLTGKVESLAVMANGYYEAPSGAVRPYVGLGLGYGDVTAKLEGIRDSDRGLAYQLMAGLAFPQGRDVALILGYRFFATEDPTLFGTTVDVQTHNLELGVRVGF